MAEPIERREQRESRETRVPIVIVPSRQTVDERQIAQLHTEHQRVRTELSNLIAYSNSIQVPPTGRTLADIQAEADRIDRTLDRMNLTSIPVLGEHYRDEIELFRGEVAQARREAQAGHIGAAVNIIGMTRDQLTAFSLVFEIELGILLGGIPPNVTIEGVTAENFLNSFFDALEAMIRDVGTHNAQRFQINTGIARNYAENAQVLNADSEPARRERDNAVGLVMARGRDATQGVAYTPEQEQSDRAALDSFVQNINTIKAQLRTHNIGVLTAWSSELLSYSQSQREESSRRYLDSLREDVDRLLTRMRNNQDVSQEEIQTLSRRYFLVVGRDPPLNQEERNQMLRQGATDLRGTARTVRDGTAEWFGEQAQQLLREGNRELAALAVAMGYLERTSTRATNGARNYISSYWQIHDIIANRRPATPGMMVGFSNQIDIATLAASADGLRLIFAQGGVREKRERVTNAAEEIRQRLSHGDMDGARRLLSMVTTYGDQLRRNNFRNWTGSTDMEAGIDAELHRQNGTDQFNRGTTQLRYSGELTRIRTAISDWGSGMAEQRRIAESAMQTVERYAREGNSRDAQRVLTLIVMYADAVERLGVRREAVVSSLSRDDARAVSGMGRGLTALVNGEARVDGREIEEVFMESFGSSQRAYVDREANRLQRLADGRSFGKETVTQALTMSRQRAAQGDFRGALVLLDYVSNYYGLPIAGREGQFRTETYGVNIPQERPTPPGQVYVPEIERRTRRITVVPPVQAREEGWRYRLFASTESPNSATIAGYATGRNELLQALRLEMNADSDQAHVAAAQLLDRGSIRIAQTELLINDHTTLSQKFNGTIPFIDEQMTTLGRVPLGERRADGSYPDYIDLSSIRSYEHNNPNDTQLGSGPTLEQILFRLQNAAFSGNIQSYNQITAEFDARFQLVAGRAVRTRTIDSTRSQLSSLQASIRQLRDLYGTSPPAAVVTRLDALEQRRNELNDRLNTMRPATAQFPAEEYSRFLVDFDHERRLAAGYAVVKNQLDLTENYRRLVVGQAQGNLMARARDYLATSRTHLEAAQTALAAGDTATAETEYRAGIYERRMGMGFYSAENALSLATGTGRSAYGRGLRSMWQFVTDNDAFWGNTPPGQAFPRFDGYQNMHADAFHDILFGSGSREEGQRIDHQLSAARLLELSIFGVPADNVSQMFSSYVEDQNSMRDLVSQANVASRAGNFAEADRIIAQVNSRWEAMNTRAQDNQWWGNAAEIGFGLAVNLVPGVGWVISGAIFTTMAFERVATEYALDGHASAAAWGNLALTVGTFGLGGAAVFTRSLAAEAVAVEATNAARLVATSRGLALLTIGVGVGMTAMMGGEAYRAFQKGNTRDGILYTGMALFPWAHMASAGIYRSFRPTDSAVDPAVRAQAAVQELQPSPVRPDINIEVTETSQTRAVAQLRTSRGLLDFLVRYVAADDAGRTRMLQTLPESARTTIRGLAENPALQRATASGGNVIDIEALSVLRRAASSFGGPALRTPAPSGTSAQWEGASWLLNSESFRAFLRDLLVPDGAETSKLNARDVARARLESLRGQNPRVAEVIDGLLRNNFVREAIISGVDTQLSSTRIEQALNGTPARTAQPARGGMPAIPARPAAPGIRDMIPQEVVAAEQQATAVLSQELELAAGGEGRVIVPNEVNPNAPRAMADQGNRGPGQGAQGPQIQPGRGTANGPVVTRGGPRGPRPPTVVSEEGAAAQAAQTGAATVEVVRVGALRQVGRWVSSRYSDWRAARAQRATAPPTPEAFAETARAALERALRMVVPQEDVPTLMSEATRGVRDSQARIEIGNEVRTAPQRIAEVMKALFRRTVSTRGAESEAALRALVKLYSFENVRSGLADLARGDPALDAALRRAEVSTLEGARRARISVAEFRSRNAQQGVTTDELMFMVEGLERETVQPLNEARNGNNRTSANSRTLKGENGQPMETRGTVYLETIEIPRIREQLSQAETAAQRLGEGRGSERAKARVAALRLQLTNSENELGYLRRFIEASENQPLARTERLLGINLTAAERGPILLRLHDAHIISDDALLYETTQTGQRALNAIRAAQTQRNPVTQTIVSSLEESVGRGGNLDDAILASLRRGDVAQAVENVHGRQYRTMFENAVREGNLDSVLNRMRETLPGEAADEVAGLVGRIRTPELSADYSLISQLGERATNIARTGMEQAGLFRRDMITPGQAVAEWWQQSFIRGGLSWLWRGARFFEYDIGAEGREILRDARSVAGMQRLGGWGRVGLQALIWGTQGYFIGRKINDVYHDFRYGGMEAGRRRCEQEFGVQCGEDNARWVSEGTGGAFMSYLPNRFPSRGDVRPGSIEQLRQQWDRDDIIINPSSFDQILTDGRLMSGSLNEINTLLQQRRAGSAEDQQRAATRLNEILRGFNITVDSIDQLLTRENKSALDITDLTDLRIPDWLSRGMAVRFRDMIVDMFLTETGVQHARGDTNTTFLLNNREAFEFVWQAFQRGNIPAAYVDGAVRTLSAPGIMEGLRGRVNPRTTLDSLIRDALVNSHFYIEVQMAGGVAAGGILQNSFLGLIDRRTVPSYPANASAEQIRLEIARANAARATMQQLLQTYQNNPQALAAFNSFNVREGESGEDLYGDPVQLAQLILNNRQNAADVARAQGFIGPAILAQVDPNIINSNDLVRFVREHSDAQHGVIQWIRERKDQIVSLNSIIRDLSTTQMAASMSATDIQAYLDRQTERYRQSGWWRGPTPAEVAAAQERARQRAPLPPPGGSGQRPQSREEQIRDTGRPQYGRRPGFEVVTPRRTDDQTRTGRNGADETVTGEQAPPVPVVVDLSTQGEAFFNDNTRSGALAAAIDGMVERMYNDVPANPRRGVAPTDGQIMREVYGQDLDRAKRQVKAEIFRLLTSTNERDVTLRTGWGITVTGDTDHLRVEFEARRMSAPLRNYMLEFVRSQRNQGGR